MTWPPNTCPIANPVNITYQIPMNVIYGPGLPIPGNAPATLDINVEEIRREIVDVIF